MLVWPCGGGGVVYTRESVRYPDGEVKKKMGLTRGPLNATEEGVKEGVDFRVRGMNARGRPAAGSRAIRVNVTAYTENTQQRDNGAGGPPTAED